MPDVFPILLVRPAQWTELGGTAHHNYICHADRKVPVHLAALRDIGNADMSAWARPRDIHFPRVWLQDACDHLEQRALSRAVRSHHRHTLSGVQMEVNILECR